MQQTLRFLMGDSIREIDDPPPTMTVLDWLRTEEGRRGSKEGCGEGDCGACTVVVGGLEGDGLRYRAVNACICFLATLDGKHLLTIEDLRGADGRLHPVQRAMVDCHGSQCGYCTPGFVMSLYALHLERTRPDLQRINDALAGNLCRCTGYGPIIAAAQSMHDLEGPDPVLGREDKIAETLAALKRDDMLVLRSGGQRLLAPRSADKAARTILDHPDAILLSGGTDVGLWVTRQLRELRKIIYLGEVIDLKNVDVVGPQITIGAGATLDDIHPVIMQHFPDFGEVIRRFGSMQVRNVATLCANVANGSPIGDSSPILIALGARVFLRRGHHRRDIAIEDFFIDYGVQDLQPGEFIESITIPLSEAATVFRAYKVSRRFDQDISAVCGAFSLTLSGGHLADVRIGLGGMAATPVRAYHAEAAMRGRTWGRKTVERGVEALARDVTPIDDLRASAGYRMLVARNLLRKAFMESTSEAPRTRVLEHQQAVHAV